MSRTWKDDVRQSRDRHPDAPYWRFGWWLNHGSKRWSGRLRRVFNRIRRAQHRAAVLAGRDPEPNRRDLSWLYW